MLRSTLCRCPPHAMMARCVASCGDVAPPQDEGREASTALQMALLNCCVIAGRQICTMIVAAIEGGMSLQAALPCIFIMAATMQVLAALGASQVWVGQLPLANSASWHP